MSALSLVVAAAISSLAAAQPQVLPVLTPGVWCVIKRDLSVIPWTLYQDESKLPALSLYIQLVHTATFDVIGHDIYDILAEFVANGGYAAYSGDALANIASNVLSRTAGVSSGGSVASSYQYVHLLWNESGDGSLAIDMFDSTQSYYNAAFNVGYEHGYNPTQFFLGQSGTPYATVESCLGTFNVGEDCSSTGADGYPCAFTNVNLQDTPFTMKNDFWIDPNAGSVHVFQYDPGNQLINMLAGGNCGYTQPLNYTTDRASVTLRLWEHLTICPSATPSSSITSTPSSSVTSTPSQSKSSQVSPTGTPSSSHTGTPSKTQTGTPSSSRSVT
jgi:hypothetical protein